VIEKQFEELKLTGNLPSPNGVGLAILRATQRDDVSLDEVVQILRADPTLTGRILKLANSVANSRLQPAGTVREAAARLGLRTVRNVSLGFSLLAGSRTGRCRAFDYDGYWSHSLATAVACQCIVEQRGGVDPGEAFTLGLLSGIGRLALASVHPMAYGQILELSQGGSALRLAEIEQECLGTHHRELAAALLRDWNLPEAFSQVVALVGSGSHAEELGAPAVVRLAQTLQGARDLARAMTTPFDASPATCRQRVAELELLRGHLELEQQGLEELWGRVVESWRQWGDAMRVRAQLQMSLVDLRASAARIEIQARESPGDPSAIVDTSLGLGDAEVDPNGLRVLLAVHDSAMRRALIEHLEQDGHTVLMATDGQRAMDLALEQAPHVLVTEWGLPGLSGPELVHSLRQSEVGKRLHAILLTDRSEEKQVLEAFELGVDEYLGRPCDPRVLQARVRAAQRVVRLDERVTALLREREAQISQLAIAKRKLQVMAVTDALTGLPNRRYALERLQGEVAAARRNGTTLSVMMVDIDRFKSVNDQHGHDVGDVVLRETARNLRASLRSVDVVCRLGGEEFLVICPGTELPDAARVGERLCAVVRERVIAVPGFERAVTVSVGVASLDDSLADADALVKQADERVYLAKEGGRDRVVTAGRTPAARRKAG